MVKCVKCEKEGIFAVFDCAELKWFCGDHATIQINNNIIKYTHYRNILKKHRVTHKLHEKCSHKGCNRKVIVAFLFNNMWSNYCYMHASQKITDNIQSRKRKSNQNSK